MFTVCPKCALTLVVTAADLRVAQGYVRCGRCSNVFNALSRLSEDRQAAAAAAQAQASPESAPSAASQQRPDATGTFRTRIAHDPSASGSTRQAEDVSASAKLKSVSDSTRKAAQPSPPPAQPQRYDDDTVIPEEDLEFNPDATDLNKVFVEQPPSPQFTAATGTFKAIRMEVEGSTRALDQLAQTDERAGPRDEHFDPTDTQVDVEIDPDLLATMAQLTTKERANPTRPDPAPTPAKAPETAAPKAPPQAKQPVVFHPPLEQPPAAPPPMRLAERAKARAEAARTGTTRPAVVPRPDAQQADGADSKSKSDTPRAPAFEAARRPTTKGKEVAEPDGTFGITTTQAIRAALAPRRRPPLADFGQAANAEPTSFFAGMWTTGSLLLLLLLTIQVVHHYRHDLAANPTLNGPLTAIYAVLGIPVVPRWDLGAYEVRQLGASTAADAPGQITVRASVKNAARQAQPLPLLRVTLQDRFANRIASQDVPPQSYLPRAIPSSSLLSAGQRIDAEMTFVDPGSNAVGFEIDACLPAPGGGISCANDAAR
jgi:predicted Zn finger-like uncharacterized protein